MNNIRSTTFTRVTEMSLKQETKGEEKKTLHTSGKTPRRRNHGCKNRKGSRTATYLADMEAFRFDIRKQLTSIFANSSSRIRNAVDEATGCVPMVLCAMDPKISAILDKQRATSTLARVDFHLPLQSIDWGVTHIAGAVIGSDDFQLVNGDRPIHEWAVRMKRGADFIHQRVEMQPTEAVVQAKGQMKYWSCGAQAFEYECSPPAPAYGYPAVFYPYGMPCQQVMLFSPPSCPETMHPYYVESMAAFQQSQPNVCFFPSYDGLEPLEIVQEAAEDIIESYDIIDLPLGPKASPLLATSSWAPVEYDNLEKTKVCRSEEEQGLGVKELNVEGESCMSNETLAEKEVKTSRDKADKKKKQKRRSKRSRR
ncbi:hypothetical protein HDU67_004150 [Dinochytrium kinnereticum]|nr:hypothetical protein HDU67_004150 [Dinochytrium kinnereticum]